MATYYDPDEPPVVSEWKELSFGDRLRIAKNFHNTARIKATKQHAYLHVFIEDQVASGNRLVIRALDRLQSAGFRRHAAIHAVAEVFNTYYRGLPLAPSREEQSAAQLRLNAELDALAANLSLQSET